MLKIVCCIGFITLPPTTCSSRIHFLSKRIYLKSMFSAPVFRFLHFSATYTKEATPSGIYRNQLAKGFNSIYKTCILVHFNFFMILHFLVLQCTTNGATHRSNMSHCNLHRLRSILNPIMSPLHSEIRVPVITVIIQSSLLKCNSRILKKVFD